MFFQSFVGHLLSYLIMPAQLKPLHKKEKNTIADLGSFLEIQNLSLSVPNSNAVVNACLYKNPYSVKDVSPFIIIHAVANSDYYENHHTSYINETTEYFNATVLAFNFRNVQHSQGKACSEKDWINDALTVIKYCEEQGFSPENILLEGHSLGGAILTLAAAKKYQQDRQTALHERKELNQVKSVRLINNRSFSNLTEVVLNFPFVSGIINSVIYLCPLSLLLNISMPTLFILSLGAIGLSKIAPTFSRMLARPWLKGALQNTFGNMDAASAFESLPDEAKDHLYAKHDFIADNNAGLHSTLKTKRQQKKKALKEQLNDPTITIEDAEKLKTELINIKDSKLCYPDSPTDGLIAHNVDLFYLTTYHKEREEQINGKCVLRNKICKLLKQPPLPSFTFR